VDAWLDVLVTMLSIPKADRQTVRDELEDHLRSRIDDLLIHGLTQPQALEKAVAELGETADLARQLSHAHKPPRTRRYAMHALIIALTGTVVALGVNSMQPNAGLPVAQIAQPASGDSAAEEQPRFDLSAVEISVPPGGQLNTLEHLQRLAAEAGMRLEIDHHAIDEFDSGWLWLVIAYPQSHSGSVTFASIMQQMTITMESDLQPSAGNPNRIVVAESDGTLLVTTARGLDIRSTIRSVYPLARFAENAPDPVRGTQADMAYERVMRAVSQHVSPMDWQDNGGDLATGTVLGSSLIVTAPARIHEQIGTLLDDLHAQAVDQAEQRQAAEAARRAVADHEHGRLVARVKAEYERALSEQISVSAQLERLEMAVSDQHMKLSALPAENRKEAADAIHREFARIGAEIRTHQIRLEEAVARVDYLRARMIEIEYEPLVRAREPSSARNPNVQPGVIEIRGDVARAGMYEYRLGLTLNRMLLAAGGMSDPVSSTIQLIRNGEVVGEWSAREVQSLPGVDAAILPGDTIAVVD
jgi:hypothetical protein